MTVADQLRVVALNAHDATGYFPGMYYVVTNKILDRWRDFEDPGRMMVFTDFFANRYLNALADPPKCWQATFAVADDESLVIAQHLLLGINAHVNFDLCQTAVDVAQALNIPLVDLHDDFLTVNLLLTEAYVDVIAKLDRVSRWTNKAMSLGLGDLFHFSLRRARDQAWNAAVRLDAGEDFLEELDELVGVIAYLIANPGPVEYLTMFLRRLESQDPTGVAETFVS